MTLRAANMRTSNSGNSSWPFSMLVSAEPASENVTEAHQWSAVRSLAINRGPTELTRSAKFVAVNQPEPKHHSESMALKLSVGHRQAQAEVLVYHIPHQGLGVSLRGLRNLGETRIGGLLGTETSIEDGESADHCSDKGKLRIKTYHSTESGSTNSAKSLLGSIAESVFLFCGGKTSSSLSLLQEGASDAHASTFPGPHALTPTPTCHSALKKLISDGVRGIGGGLSTIFDAGWLSGLS